MDLFQKQTQTEKKSEWSNKMSKKKREKQGRLLIMDINQFIIIEDAHAH